MNSEITNIKNIIKWNGIYLIFLILSTKYWTFEILFGNLKLYLRNVTLLKPV